MAQLFANAARGELASALTDAATTLTLSSPAGTLFPVANRGTGSTGDWFRIVVQDATYYEVMLVRTHTSGANTFSNVLRGQEGTTARAFAAGSTVGLRVTAADAAGWGLPDGGTTDDFLDGGRAWSSLATKVRGAALTGLSVLSTAAITATDSVLSAFGKLQAQLNSHLNQGGGVHPNATTSESGFMSSADKTKLNGIAVSAAALGDVVALDLGTASAGSGSTAARIDHRHKLPTAAEVGAAPSAHVGAGGAAHANATTSADGFMSSADKTKLNGVASGATANATDAQLRDRSTHTGTQAISTVTDLQTALDTIPANVKASAYTLVLTDAGKSIDTTSNVTIPANSAVAFAVGTTIMITNTSASNSTISINTDTLRQAGTTNTGSRTLAGYGIATLRKVNSITWYISGAGLS